MKRLLLTMLVLTSAVTSLLAQQGLSVNEAFDGKYRNKEDAIETIVTGKQVEQYGLSLYHSLSVTDKDGIVDLRCMVAADSKNAINKEEGLKNGEINYGFYEFSPLESKKPNRFIFFFSNDAKAVLIYMEGHTKIGNIKSIIKK